MDLPPYCIIHDGSSPLHSLPPRSNSQHLTPQHPTLRTTELDQEHHTANRHPHHQPYI
ncbi:uncharacterized protein L969DRAFT_97074 [Mixia osmundae IAM 14324]|uniref:Uncharacterized protein n=1 Tax=Mixia osmundae (strain CBS 9802 / IAM 14324 / JCM 22182 / KY 12970) TaxID=764103 RepID=G7E1L2_MIXOS|nr:uncharacterized protein L969DRAFT_97074 [Mixia osmundae IAM 14324]KEI36674.1 hypothetical protein L969DRAFT_97074 [Mixia osmundae IAM 14324]GAA96722.1 hypothetical protein E5Q_03393 [Mixia osmundae IAM 14324]